MVVIRLARIGSTHKPKYRIVAADSRRSATGRFIAVLGHYDSLCKDKTKAFKLDTNLYKKWISLGAKPSRTMHSLAKKAMGISEPKGQSPALKEQNSKLKTKTPQLKEQKPPA